MNDNEFFELLKMRLQECRDIQNSEAIPSIKAMARKKVIDALTVEHSDNWQCVATPYDIINEMCDLVKEAEHYIVFFSLEFLEVMIKERGISPDKIFFIADNIAESQVASHSSMYGVKSIVFSKNDVNLSKNHSDLLYMCINKIGDFMNFNKLAVIGNPPYQVPDEGDSTGAKPIYNLFVESVIDNMKPDYFTFIIPSRWMIGGKGLDNHRERMMNDSRMKTIVHFEGERTIFPSVQITGGVNYFLWVKDYSGECEFVNGNSTTKRLLNTHDIIIQDNNAVIILDKVMSKSSKWISEKCLSRKPFGLRTNFNDFKISGVKCICERKEEKFVDPTAFTDNGNVLAKWKVVCPKGAGGHQIPDSNGAKMVMKNIFVIETNAVCTETYIVINAFDTKKEADNFVSFVQSKFFRFMLGLRVFGVDVNKDKFSWVPDMLDYSAPWTDVELYKKFNLTRQEIAYIESKIKAI